MGVACWPVWLRHQADHQASCQNRLQVVLGIMQNLDHHPALFSLARDAHMHACSCPYGSVTLWGWGTTPSWVVLLQEVPLLMPLMTHHAHTHHPWRLGGCPPLIGVR